MGEPEDRVDVTVSSPDTVWDRAWRDVQDSPAPDPELAERLTALTVAANAGRTEADYQTRLADPVFRQELEDLTVSTIGGGRGEAWRSEVHAALEGIAAGKLGYLADPWELNVAVAADPVQLANGSLQVVAEDFRLAGAGIDFVFQRTYRNQVVYAGPLGIAWSHTYDIRLRERPGEVVITTGELRQERYRQHPVHAYFAPPDGTDGVVLQTATSFLRRSPDGMVHEFEQDPTGAHRLARVRDRFTNTLVFQYDDTNGDGGRLATVLVNHPARFVRFAYDELGRIVSAIDHTGRVWRYGYDNLGDLVTVTSPATADHRSGLRTEYEYRTPWVTGLAQHNLSRIIDASGRLYLECEFGEDAGQLAFNRVIWQRQGGGDTVFDYEPVDAADDGSYPPEQRPSMAAIVTEPNGNRVVSVFNDAGNVLQREQHILQGGRTAALIERYRYDRDGHVVAAMSPEGSVTQYLYGRELFRRKRGLDDDDSLWEHPDLTPSERQQFGQLRCVVRRAVRVNASGLLTAAPWGAFPDIASASGAAGDEITCFGYEREYARLSFVTDPRRTPLADPDFPFDPEEVTRFEYDGPAADPSRHLVAVHGPRVTAPDGTLAPEIRERYVQTDGTPAYDARGRLLRKIDGAGVVTVHDYVPEAANDPRSGFLRRTVIDPGGLALTTTWEVDALGRVVATTLPRESAALDGRFVSHVQYDEMDRVVEHIGVAPFSLATRYRYDNSGKVIETEEATWDAAGNPTFGGARIRRARYDERFNLSREELVAADGSLRLQTLHVYDPAGQRILTLDPGGTSTRFRYDQRMLAVARDRGYGTSEAARTRIQYDGDGRGVQTVDAMGVPTTFDYDALARVRRETNAHGTVALRDYDRAGNLVVERIFEPGSQGFTLVARRQIRYDEAGRPIESGQNLFETAPPAVREQQLDTAFRDVGPDRLLTTQVTYDGAGKVISEVSANGAVVTHLFDSAGRNVGSRDPLGNTTELGLDEHGNVTRETRTESVLDPSNGTEVATRAFATWSTYDELDRVAETIDLLGNRWQFRYDSSGNRTNAIDPLGNATRTSFDLSGRMSTISRSLTNTGFGSGQPVGTATTAFTHDGNGNLIQVVDALGHLTRHEYDALDRRTTTIRADGRRTEAVYDRNGRLVRLEASDGTVRNYRHDELGRTVRVDVQAAASVGGSRTEVIGYNALGLRVLEENENARVTLRRSSIGWPTEEETQLAGPGAPGALRLLRRFDDEGNLVQLRYPGGRIVNFNRDVLGRLLAVGNADNGAAYPGDNAANAVRPLQAIQWSGLQHGAYIRANGTSTVFAYDGLGRTLEIDHRANSGRVTVQHLYDGVHNVRFRQTTTDGISRALRLHYDSSSWLVHYEQQPPTAINGAALAPAPLAPPAPGTGQQTIDQLSGLASVALAAPLFTYDLGGNRIGDRTSGTLVAMQPTPTDEIDTRDGVQFEFDGRGDLASDGPRRIRYDSLGRITDVTDVANSQPIVSFAYDVRGRRVATTVGGATRFHIYDGEALISEFEAGQLVSQVVNADATDEPIHLAAGGRDLWLHADQVGSIVQATDASGAVASRYEYEPFGLPTLRPPNDPNPFLFQGRPWDAGAGLYDMRARQYDPRLGRFLQPDPIEGDGANSYAFARNNPMAFSDPHGLEARPAYSKYVAFRTSEGIEIQEDDLSPWGTKRDELKAFGFQVVELPWEEIQRSVSQLSPVRGADTPTTPGLARDTRNFVAAFATDMILGALPPSLVGFYDKRAYVADTWIPGNRSGLELYRYMDERNAARFGYASTHINYWTNTATAPISGFTSGAGEIMSGFLRGLQRAKAGAPLLKKLVGPGARRLIRTAADVTLDTTQHLLQMRNAAVDLTRRYAADAAVRGFRMRPTEFGTMADAILKAHVLEAVDKGVLPATLQVVKRGLKGPDIYDTATGLAWDLMTATGRSVIDHEKYVGMAFGGPNGPASVSITEVIPLVYTRN